MSNIFVRIIGEFKDKEFKRAQKSTLGLNKSFDNLRRTAVRAFVAVAGVSALKRSVKAFAEEDAAVKKLAKSLDNLGLRFQAGGVDEYLDSLEKATAVTKDQLYPAFQQLASTTLSVGKAQNLLNTALDISAGTGKDLGSVVVALNRAFNGNFASLGKLQTSYTTAELEAMGFQKAMEALNTEFSGQAQNAADTYEGKIKKLNIAFEDAAEAIGEGVVDALEALGSGNYDKGLERIVTFGEKIGDAFRGAARFVSATRLIFGSFTMSSKEFQAAAMAINSAFAPEDPAKQRTLMRDRSKNLAKEQAQTEKLRKEREKAAKATEKERKEQDKLNKLRSRFNLEKIQIAAALQGKLTQEQVVRLQLMQALENDNVKRAEELTEKLIKMQEAQRALAASQESLTTSNPFIKISEEAGKANNSIKEVDKSLKILGETEPEIQIKLNVSELEAGIARVNAALGAYQNQVLNALSPIYNNPIFSNNIVSGLNIKQKQMIDEYIRTGRTDILVDPVNPSADLMGVINTIRERERLYNQSREAYKSLGTGDLMTATEQLFGALGTTTSAAMSGATVVNVNVEGNVITEQDLAQTIIDQQYQYQRSGGKLTYNTVAI